MHPEDQLRLGGPPWLRTIPPAAARGILADGTLDDRYRALLKLSIDPVLVVDGRLRIVEWSQAAETTFGYSREEAIGADVTELVIPARLADTYRAGIPVALARTAELPAFQGRNRTILVRKGGEEFNADLLLAFIGEGEGAVVVALVRDMSESDVEAARREASLAQGHFLAVMTHELRTPLNAVLGFSQLLESDPALTDGQRRYAQSIGGGGRDLRLLVDGILSLAEISTGKVELRLGEISLVELLEAASAQARPQAEAAGLELVTAATADVHFRGDRDRVLQVLANVVGNAVRFTPAGGRVTLAGAALGEGVEILVTDTGIGISLNDQERIFDEFTQADSGLRRSQGGVGMGLALAQRLARLLGGDLTVSSVVGSGSTFTLTLPGAPPPVS